MALELGLSRPELDDMLKRLCALGYVEELSDSMASSCIDDAPKACEGCAGCAVGCFPGSKVRLWTLSPKGVASLASEARAELE
jgi:hypothetical protein